MRIASLVPGATDTLYRLGLGEQVVAVSHACDTPPNQPAKPRISRTTVDVERSSGAIDEAVRRSVAQGEALYTIDEALLRDAIPDLLVVQDLCDVCAVSGPSVRDVAGRLPRPPRVIALGGSTLEGVFDDIRRLGYATGVAEAAEALVSSLQERLRNVRERLRGIAARVRVVCLEWLDPPMTAGHWVPEMVGHAGGTALLSRAGSPSGYVRWNDLVDARPDTVLVMPCGFSIERTRQELTMLGARPEWTTLARAANGRVYLLNGPAYFNRPGPRLVDGVELLAGVLHPERCPLSAGGQDAVRWVQAGTSGTATL